ncbi:hypothetical protein ACWC3X_13590 [Streptomyces populi]
MAGPTIPVSREAWASFVAEARRSYSRESPAGPRRVAGLRCAIPGSGRDPVGEVFEAAAAASGR